MLLNFGPRQVLVIVSICISLRTANGVPLAHDTGAIPYQNDKATDNEHLSDLFIYYMHSFLLRMLHR